jgi:hypothetical protein
LLLLATFRMSDRARITPSISASDFGLSGVACLGGVACQSGVACQGGVACLGGVARQGASTACREVCSALGVSCVGLAGPAELGPWSTARRRPPRNSRVRTAERRPGLRAGRRR